MGLLSSKIDALKNGPNKALLVLYSTPREREVAGSIPIKKDKFGLKVVETQAKLAGSGLATTGDMGNYVLEVQYNPSSISFTASAESMPIKPLQPAFDPNVPLSASIPPSIIMMIELIFDDIIVPDAFMYDKFNISIGNIANDVLLSKDQTPHTVQPQTNGLLAAMQREATRKIALYWADMQFYGEIKDMQAKYTMFSVSGRPIRSVVNITVVQNAASNKQAVEEYWDNNYNEIFGLDGFYSARTKAQKVGALINVY